MSIRFGISMTCFSFANVLRARKFFWICDAMMSGSPFWPQFGRDLGMCGRCRLPRRNAKTRPKREMSRAATDPCSEDRVRVRLMLLTYATIARLLVDRRLDTNGANRGCV